jgi:hypothetical protein
MEDTALYIKHNGRSWCVWTTPHDGGLRAIPEDEKDFDDNDLEKLAFYLREEGFLD